MITCRKCGGNPSKDPVILDRVNEKGAPGIWECRSSCGTRILSDDERMVETIEDDEPGKEGG